VCTEIYNLMAILKENFKYLEQEVGKLSFMPDALDIHNECETFETVIYMLTSISECMENLLHYTRVRNDNSSKQTQRRL
jgi:hypothetical protein